MFHGKSDSSMCVPSLGWTLNWESRLRELAHIKDPTVSFAKSRRAIAGTKNKYKIPATTTAGKAMANHPEYNPGQ